MQWGKEFEEPGLGVSHPDRKSLDAVSIRSPALLSVLLSQVSKGNRPRRRSAACGNRLLGCFGELFFNKIAVVVVLLFRFDWRDGNTGRFG